MKVNKNKMKIAVDLLKNDPYIDNDTYFKLLASKGVYEHEQMLDKAEEIDYEVKHQNQEPAKEVKLLNVVNDVLKNNIRLQKELIKNNDELKRISLELRKEIEND